MVLLVLHVVLHVLFPAAEDGSEGVFEHQAEVSNLREAEVDGVKNSDSQQDVHQEFIPEQLVEPLYVVYCIHA